MGRTIHETTIDLLEPSAHIPPADAPFLRSALIALLRRRGLDPDTVSTTVTVTVTTVTVTVTTVTKTRLALDHLTNPGG